jgi:peroxiredoxin
MNTALKVGGALVYLALTSWVTYQVKHEEAGSRPGAGKLGRVGVGDVAPDFTLEDLDGQRVSLADYRGRVVVVDFWATWCPPCRMVMMALDSFYEKQRNSGVVLLAINQEEKPGWVRRKMGSRKHSFRVLLDQDGQVGGAYGVSAIPALVMVDQKGRIAWINVGYRPDLEKELSGTLRLLSRPGGEGQERRDVGNLDRRPHEEVRR